MSRVCVIATSVISSVGSRLQIGTMRPAEYPPGVRLDLASDVGRLGGRWLAAAADAGAVALVLPAIERHNGPGDWRYVFADKAGRRLALSADSAPGTMTALLEARVPDANFLAQVFRYRKTSRRWYHHLGCACISGGDVFNRLPRRVREPCARAAEGGLTSRLIGFLCEAGLADGLELQVPGNVRPPVVSDGHTVKTTLVESPSRRVEFDNVRVIGELMYAGRCIGDGVEIETQRAVIVSWAIALERFLTLVTPDARTANAL